jgi:hemerythrin-like metal-binding protein
MSIQWGPALATGVRQIDLQHRELIDLIHDLEAAHAAGDPDRALREALPRLVAYALFHFSTEEALLAGRRAAAAHLRQHAREHQAFVAEIDRQSKQPPEQADLEALIGYLNQWLVGHIMHTDRELATLVLDPGFPAGGR